MAVHFVDAEGTLLCGKDHPVDVENSWGWSAANYTKDSMLVTCSACSEAYKAGCVEQALLKSQCDHPKEQYVLDGNGYAACGVCGSWVGWVGMF